MTRALIVIDMQRAFDDLDFWGATTNPDCERNVAALIDAWAAAGEPIVVVRHDSTSPRFAAASRQRRATRSSMPSPRSSPALFVTKNVNSAFYGDPDLQAWLGEQGIRELVICGIQTNMCVETTARMAGNLGYDVTVALDATRTFDLTGGCRGPGYRDPHGGGAHGDDRSRPAGGRIRADRDHRRADRRESNIMHGFAALRCRKAAIAFLMALTH